MPVGMISDNAPHHRDELCLFRPREAAQRRAMRVTRGALDRVQHCDTSGCKPANSCAPVVIAYRSFDELTRFEPLERSRRCCPIESNISG